MMTGDVAVLTEPHQHVAVAESQSPRIDGIPLPSPYVPIVFVESPLTQPPRIKGIITGEDLRERARRSKHEMEKAREEADRARREGNHYAAKVYGRDALAHRNAMKDLNKEAAKVTFKEKNKVRLPSRRDVRS